MYKWAPDTRECPRYFQKYTYLINVKHVNRHMNLGEIHPRLVFLGQVKYFNLHCNMYTIYLAFIKTKI